MPEKPSRTRTPRAKRERRAPRQLAAGLDPAARAATTLQLRRVRGQIEGIERMIDTERYFGDVIIQIIAARASLQTVAKSLLETHLLRCHELAQSNGGASADKMYQDIVRLVSRMAQ